MKTFDDTGGKVWQGKIDGTKRQQLMRDPQEELHKLLAQLTDKLDQQELPNVIMACRGLYVVAKAQDIYRRFGGVMAAPTRENLTALAPRMLAVSTFFNLTHDKKIWESIDKAIEYGNVT